MRANSSFLKILVCFLICNEGISQSLHIYSGKIVDSGTNVGIEGVHIYNSDETKVGTITNSEGKFVLKSQQKINSLIVSHIAYVATEYSIFSNDNIKVSLKPVVINLQTVEITTLTASAVMEKVIENLAVNHFVEPVTYHFFTRIIHVSEDSTLNYLEEYVGYIHHKKNHRSRFSLDKGRRKAFTNVGEEKMSQYLILLAHMYNDNIGIHMPRIIGIGIFPYDFLHKRRLRKFEFSFKDEINFLGQNVYVIKYKYKADPSYRHQSLLYISKDDFGIVRMSNGFNDEFINFKKINNKYYLASSSYTFGSGSKRTIIYNLTDISINQRYFVSLGMLFRPEFTKQFFGDFEDDFWETNNYIPLPEWIKKQLR